MSEKKEPLHFDTLSIHTGTDRSANYGAISTPIYQSSVYAFENAEKGSAIHEGELPGYFYGRINNPTQEALEGALAELERGEAAIVFASGMAAISNGLLTLLQSGDHLVAPASIYASTSGLLNYLQASLGIEVSFVDGTDPLAYKQALKANTRLLYLESPANPTLKLCDVKAVTAIAREHSLKTMMDNTFATPYNQNPLDDGVDVVVHSMTKYIGGHGDILAGALIGSSDLVETCRWNVNKYFGGVAAPMTCWLALRGIKTLAVRMQRHNENALEVAKFLESHPQVKQVHYPGLESHPQHDLGKRQMRGFGGVISFEVGGLHEGRTLVDHVELCTLAVSLGDVSTLIQHSASMTHASVSPELRELAGIGEGLIRLSVGIENKQDIIADLAKALKAIK